MHHKTNFDYAAFFKKSQGTWISYEYILNLKKTLSPSGSAAYMEGIFSFTIDSTRLVDDTLHCTSWVNGHAERDMWIAFSDADSADLHNVGLNKKDDQQGKNDENYTKIKIDSPFITIYTNIFDSVRYVFYADLPRNAPPDHAIKYYTTKALFNSCYFIKDSNRIFGSSNICFDPQNIGHISGSKLYDSFDINVNALSKSDSSDYMEFFDSRHENESRSFVYKFKNKTLLIYPDENSKPCLLSPVSISDTSLNGDK